jgi:hypothetical protein
MNPGLAESLDRGLFDLIGYMLSSARGLFDEPAEYGPFRLAEGVSRLCSLLAAAPAGSGSRYQDFLLHLKELIDEGKFSLMTDPEAFIRMLDQAVLAFTRRMKQDGAS